MVITTSSLTYYLVYLVCLESDPIVQELNLLEQNFRIPDDKFKWTEKFTFQSLDIMVYNEHVINYVKL